MSVTHPIRAIDGVFCVRTRSELSTAFFACAPAYGLDSCACMSPRVKLNDAAGSRHITIEGVAALAIRGLPGVRALAAWLAYSVVCSLLHGLLQQHYLHTCRSSWLSLLVADTGAYCAFVRKGLSALQWSPVLLLLPFPPAPHAVPTLVDSGGFS